MEKTFKTKVTCTECGTDLPAERAAYETQAKRYCAKCRPIQALKQSWQPMHSGYSVSAIYIVPSKPVPQAPSKIAGVKNTG